MLTLKRIYQSEIVLIATSSMSVADALEKHAAIAAYPERMSNEAKGQQGEIWFEVEDKQGDLISDVVCFAPDVAEMILIRAGMPASQAAQILSDDYAREQLAAYYDDMGMPNRAARFK